ncbi:hypothetical protein Hte_003721 [Hypoxylon texense]
MAFIRRLSTSLTNKPTTLFLTSYIPSPLSSQNVAGTATRRLFSAEAVSHPSNRVQVYISRASDPYLNLSIEHYLLQKSPPDSVVLFLYANRPCVVVGRNQNPWVEVNLGLLGRSGVVDRRDGKPRDVQLVRRRSGGGAVFHDAGNVNYSVVCPPESFDRNKHADMVVRALSTLDIGGSARVNERHDIVLDVTTEGKTQTFKISGSAYKLTRLRSLHHGTCLLSSPNLPLVGPLLRSPAAPYIKARGVESVRSPIRNVGIADNAAFEEAVVAEFGAMYGNADPEVIGSGGGAADILEDVQAIAEGCAELRSPEWIFAQTPQFTFSTHPTDEDPRPRPPLPDDLPSDFRATMTVRHGQITEVSGASLLEPLKSTYLHHVADWSSKVGNDPVGKWLNGLFGVGKS